MHSEHPGAAYQGKARGRYASRAPRNCIPGQGQRQVCIQSTQELHTRARPEASMHPKNLPDAYRKKGLKAVHKRFETEGAMKYEAKGEEASEMRKQQQCILNGGVYLLHRLEKQDLKD